MTTETRHGGAIVIENAPVKMVHLRLVIPADLKRLVKIYQLQHNFVSMDAAIADALTKFFEGEGKS